MFNAEQREHMDYLASIPASERCWCGWGLAERCDTFGPCPPDVTLAVRIATEMPCCRRPAARPDCSRTTGSHYAGCTAERRDYERSLFDLGGEA
jgi:hypothetical protein